jgi:hypothetical protein
LRCLARSFERVLAEGGGLTSKRVIDRRIVVQG